MPRHQDHRTRPIRAPETPARSQRHQRQRDSRTCTARHLNAILLGAHLPTSGHQSLDWQTLGRRSSPRARRRHAHDRRRSPHRRADGQDARQAGQKPPPRKTGLHGLRGGPASRPAVDGRRSPRRLHHCAHEPPPTLRSHAPQIHPLRPQSHQADAGRSAHPRRAHPSNGARHARNHAGVRRRARSRLSRTGSIPELVRQTRARRD